MKKKKIIKLQDKTTTQKKYKQWFVLLFVFLVFFFAYLHVTQFKATSRINIISIPPVSNADHIRGNPDALVTLVEYSDFECPECQYFQPTIRQILSAYGKNIRWIVRPYPLPQHMNAEKEAEAAECVAFLKGNDAYWKFSDLLFAHQTVTNDGTGFPIAKLSNVAQQAGVSIQKFTTCLASGKFYPIIQNTVSAATKAGINQLPSTVVIDKTGNMQVIVGDQPFAVYKNIIEQSLK